MPVAREPGFRGGIPAGVVLAYAGATAPKGWLACDGAAVSRSVYGALFAALGTTHGAGDGSTTFNLPDCTGRSIYGKEASETRITTAVSGVNGGTLGAAGGAQSVTISTGQLPASGLSIPGLSIPSLSVSGSFTSYNSSDVTPNRIQNASVNTGGDTTAIAVTGSTGTGTTGTGTTGNMGTGGALNKLGPTIILNYIIKF